MTTPWKSGRGALGALKPLLGAWACEADGPGAGGKIRVTRRFEPVLGAAYVRLEARWELGGGKAYEEIALFGKGEDGGIAFTSFTSDGKQARGVKTDGSDVHPDAIAFEAQMPAGLARFVYWPADGGEGYYFAVESRTKKGWNRFLRHHYLPARSRIPAGIARPTQCVIASVAKQSSAASEARWIASSLRSSQ